MNECTDAEIHALMQDPTNYIYDLIEKYKDVMDNHVLVCESCQARVRGFTIELPQFRKKMTVFFPPTDSDGERIRQMEQLKLGQCLPCGCVVTGVAWTWEQARNNFFTALAEVLGVSEEQAKEKPLQTNLCDLGLSTEALRLLRDKFWTPDGASNVKQVRDAEEGNTVVGLPKTIESFIEKLWHMHYGISYAVCPDHWFL